MFTILVVVIIVLVIAFIIGVIISGKDYDNNSLADHPKVLFEEEDKKEEKVEKKAAAKKTEKKEDKKEETASLDSMTLAELKAVAKEKGLKGYSTMKKADLIAALK